MKNLWKSLTVLLITCLVAVALPTLSGCEKKEKSPMDKLGEAADKAADAAEDAADDAADAVEDATD